MVKYIIEVVQIKEGVVMYVPILKAKQGEKDALFHLKKETIKKVRPILEIPIEHIDTPAKFSIEKFWLNQSYYLDFPIEAVSEGIEEGIFDSWIMNQDFNFMIPVLHLSYEEERIRKVLQAANNRVAIRITVDEFFEEDFQNEFSQLRNMLDSKQTDIIIDAQEINEANYKKQAGSTVYCLNQIANLDLFKNIIISSGSFPKTLAIEKEQFIALPRLEIEYYKLVSGKFEIPFIYSDYCVNHWELFEYILGMQVSFNVRYTLYDSYLVYKGKTSKTGGFSYENVQEVCKKLIERQEFFGKDYSWGDMTVSDIANGVKGRGGNSTTWRSIGTNHHIEVTVMQCANLDDF